MEIMTDIESLGTAQDAVILSISAVKFDFGIIQSPEQIITLNGKFDFSLNVKDQIVKGRKIDFDTVLWWLDQSNESRHALIKGVTQAYDIVTALDSFSAYCSGASNIWGNGNTFDNVLIKSLYESFGMIYPIKYSKDLDFRTLKYLFKLRFPGEQMPYPEYVGAKPDVAHIGWIDAARQAAAAQIIYARLGGAIHANNA